MLRKQTTPPKVINLLDENPLDWVHLKRLMPHHVHTSGHISQGKIEGTEDYELSHDMLIRRRTSTSENHRYALIMDEIGGGAYGSVYDVQEVALDFYGVPHKVISPRVAKMLKLDDAKRELKYSPRHLSMKELIQSGEYGFLIMRRIPGNLSHEIIREIKSAEQVDLEDAEIINLVEKINEINPSVDESFVTLKQDVMLILIQFVSDVRQQAHLGLFGGSSSGAIFDFIKNLLRDIKSTPSTNELTDALNVASEVLKQAQFCDYGLKERLQGLVRERGSVTLSVSSLSLAGKGVV